MEIADKIFTSLHILYSMLSELKLSVMEPLNFILSLTCTESEKRQGIIWVKDMMFHATFNNISVILWRSVLLVEEIGVSEKTTDLSQVTDKHNVVLRTPRLSGI